jgi:hypothetical protein
MNDEYVVWLDEMIKEANNAVSNFENYPERIVESFHGEFSEHWSSRLDTLILCKDVYLDRPSRDNEFEIKSEEQS